MRNKVADQRNLWITVECPRDAYVFTPTGGVHSIHDTWAEAITAVDRAVHLDQFRDKKHAELFSANHGDRKPLTWAEGFYRAMQGFQAAFTSPPTQSDYALAR